MPEHPVNGFRPFLGQNRSKLGCIGSIRSRTAPHSRLVGGLSGIFGNHLAINGS